MAATKLTPAEIRKIKESAPSKSQAIITMFQKGMETGEIAKAMGIRYQFAFNVIQNHCFKTGVDMPKREKGETKKAQIIELLKKDMRPSEIAKTMQCNSNMVYKIQKEWELETRRAEAAEA